MFATFHEGPETREVALCGEPAAGSVLLRTFEIDEQVFVGNEEIFVPPRHAYCQCLDSS